MPEHRQILQLCNARKPDIVRYVPVTKSIDIVEITTCYDFYFEQVLSGKHEKYLYLLNVLENLGFKVKTHALCFRFLRNVPKTCSKMVRKIYKNRGKTKNISKWCSMSIIIGANYIW